MNKTAFFITIFLFVIFYDKTASGHVLTWSDCVKEAAKNHPDLISAEESVKQSQADKRIIASSLFPQIDSNVGVSTAETAGAKSDSYTYGVTGTQLVFDGFKVGNNVKSASEDITAKQYNYRFVSSQIRLRLRNAFITLLKAQELLKLTREIYDIRRSNLELIALRYESGIEHKGALLTAEANLAQAELEIEKNKRALDAAQRELIKELGGTESADVRVEATFEVKGISPEKPDFEALAGKHPSLGRLLAQKNSAFFGINAVKANFIPQLSAQAGVNKNDSSWPPQDNRWNAGLTLSFPLFEGGSRPAQIDRAKAIFNQARENERSGKDSIILTLEQSWAAFQDAVETVDVQKKFLEAALERSRISEAQYSLGLIQFDNWTIIEDELVRQKRAFLDAQANALFTQAIWIQAKGETLEYAE